MSLLERSVHGVDGQNFVGPLYGAMEETITYHITSYSAYVATNTEFNGAKIDGF